MMMSVKYAVLYGWSKSGRTPSGGFMAGIASIGMF